MEAPNSRSAQAVPSGCPAEDSDQVPPDGSPDMNFRQEPGPLPKTSLQESNPRYSQLNEAKFYA